MALNVPMSDFEDAVLAICAANEEADYIATNDIGFIKSESLVPARSPLDILEMLKK